MRKMKKVMSSFLNDNKDFNAYFQTYKEDLLYREDYKKLYDKINSIEREYPKVKALFKEKQFNNLDLNEIGAILKILEIMEQMNEIEYKEAFKLGGREAYVFFEEQNMLNI